MLCGRLPEHRPALPGGAGGLRVVEPSITSPFWRLRCWPHLMYGSGDLETLAGECGGVVGWAGTWLWVALALAW